VAFLVADAASLSLPGRTLPTPDQQIASLWIKKSGYVNHQAGGKGLKAETRKEMNEGVLLGGFRFSRPLAQGARNFYLIIASLTIGGNYLACSSAFWTYGKHKLPPGE
jgi:hypothetical protein